MVFVNGEVPVTGCAGGAVGCTPCGVCTGSWAGGWVGTGVAGGSLVVMVELCLAVVNQSWYFLLLIDDISVSVNGRCGSRSNTLMIW